MNDKKDVWYLMTFLFLAVIPGLYAQEVEHNYLVEPQFTDCDSLKIDGLATEKAIERVRSAKFRYQQNIKLTRHSGLKSAEFYSCNMISGLLVVQFDNEQFLFSAVSKADWEAITSSSDPEGFYLEKKDFWHLFP